MADLISTLQFVLSKKDPLLANETKRILLKEVLQAYILDFLYNHPNYRQLNFYGGTCLHTVYGLNRLSEDLDLDNGKGIPLNQLEDDLLSYFRDAQGFDQTAVKSQTGETGILRTTVKFPILYALGLSNHENEFLHLKLEISPHRQISVLRRTPIFLFGRSFVPSHFSIETMMAGKMIACLERTFFHGKQTIAVKGRDYYDLVWMMQKNIQPLEEKLARDASKPYTTRSAMLEIAEKVKAIPVTALAVDLYPLFESRVFVEAWLESFKENFEAMVKGYV
jgi:predicted nucleotidyltransferase component of viral defense system